MWLDNSKKKQPVKEKVAEKKKNYTDNELLTMMVNEQKKSRQLLIKIDNNIRFFVWLTVISLILSLIVVLMINS